VKHEPGIYERDIPDGAGLSELGINIDDIQTLGGVSLVGGGMWGDSPPPKPIGAVILMPLAKDGTEMKPLAIIQSAEKLRLLGDQFYRVFSKAADAAEELFANGGKLPGGHDETPQA
jgi:hypothetical protein